MELKTLKDLKRDVPIVTPTSSKILQGVLLETELKQEAIKWVLYGLKHKRNFFKVFMEFFNITEEDLL